MEFMSIPEDLDLDVSQLIQFDDSSPNFYKELDSILEDGSISPQSSDSGILINSPNGGFVPDFSNDIVSNNAEYKFSSNSYEIPGMSFPKPDGLQVQIEEDFDDSEDEDIDMVYSGTRNDSLPISCKSSKSNRNSKLTDEERRLLRIEGIILPEDMGLTKTEERALKRVRRKIRNKASAQLSRQKRKDYVKNLELRVKKCTDMNYALQQKVNSLESQNSTLLEKLSTLQQIVTNKFNPSNRTAQQVTTGTCLMMVLFSCLLLIFPNTLNSKQNKEMALYESSLNADALQSRSLLNYDKPLHETITLHDYAMKPLPEIVGDEDVPIENVEEIINTTLELPHKSSVENARSFTRVVTLRNGTQNKADL